MKPLAFSLTALVVAALFAGRIISATAALDGLPKPVKVFILAGQSNMEGQAVVDLDGKNYNDGKGTLKALMNDPKKAPLFKHLKNDKGEWTVRDDVWVRYQREKQPCLSLRGMRSLGGNALKVRQSVGVRPAPAKPARFIVFGDGSKGLEVPEPRVGNPRASLLSEGRF